MLRCSEMLTEDSLLGIGSDILEDFSRMVVIVDLLLDKFKEASDIFNLCSTRELLYHTNYIAHNVLCLIICTNVWHILLEYLSELVKKWVYLTHDNNGRPDDKTMQDTQALNHAFFSCILKTLDC